MCLMCLLSQLYLDDFPFFGSSLTHLEPELELFEVDDFGDDGDDGDDDLPYHYLPNFKRTTMTIQTDQQNSQEDK